MEQQACNSRETSVAQRETPTVQRGCNTLTEVRALPQHVQPRVTPSQKELVSIASTVEYELFELPGRSTPQWRCLKLVSLARTAKRNWWFGWNGERIARSSDAGKLADQHPAVYAWVIEALKGGVS